MNERHFGTFGWFNLSQGNNQLFSLSLFLSIQGQWEWKWNLNWDGERKREREWERNSLWKTDWKRGEKSRVRERERESNHLSTFIEAGNETLKNKLQFSCYIRQMAWQRVKRSPLLSHAVQGWPASLKYIFLASYFFFISTGHFLTGYLKTHYFSPVCVHVFSRAYSTRLILVSKKDTP